MSFVFFVLFCSFSKHVQNRRFCAQFGQKCVLKKRTKKIMIFVFFDLFCTFLSFLPDFVNKMSSENKKDHAAGKIARCPLSFLFLDPPPPNGTSVEYLERLLDEGYVERKKHNVHNV